MFENDKLPLTASNGFPLAQPRILAHRNADTMALKRINKELTDIVSRYKAESPESSLSSPSSVLIIDAQARDPPSSCSAGPIGDDLYRCVLLLSPFDKSG